MLNPLLAGLTPQGKLIVVAVPSAPLPNSAQALAFDGRVGRASLTGRTIEEEDTLRFSAMQGVRPMVQAAHSGHAPDAYARMMRGEARFRFVLTSEKSAVAGTYKVTIKGTFGAVSSSKEIQITVP